MTLAQLPEIGSFVQNSRIGVKTENVKENNFRKFIKYNRLSWYIRDNFFVREFHLANVSSLYT